MKLLKGNFCRLRPITEKDLPLLREWRNQTYVRKSMEYQALISETEHLAWFQLIQEEKYHYFLIETLDEIPVGTIYVSGEKTPKTAECGLYIGNLQFVGTGITLEASQLLIRFAFDELHLQTLVAKVKADNETVIRYNEALGFRREGFFHEGFLKMVLRAND